MNAHSRKSAGFLFAAVLVLLVAHPVSAQMQIYTTADSDGEASRFWGGGAGHWAVHLSDPEMRSIYQLDYSEGSGVNDVIIMQFPMAALAGQTFSGVTLNFYTKTESAGMIKYKDTVSGTGTVGELDYGGVDVAGFAQPAWGWQSTDVTAQVQDALGKGYAWIILSAQYNSTWEDGAKDGFSDVVYVKGFEETGYGPYLDVVPEPASMSLLGLGALALLRKRR